MYKGVHNLSPKTGTILNVDFGRLTKVLFFRKQSIQLL
jgi:hypothetical protein